MIRREFPPRPYSSGPSRFDEIQDWLYTVTGIRSRIMKEVIKRGGVYSLPCYKVASIVADDIARWGGAKTPQKYINKAAAFTLAACAKANPRRRS
jgi:hypothetical protein